MRGCFVALIVVLVVVTGCAVTEEPSEPPQVPPTEPPQVAVPLAPTQPDSYTSETSPPSPQQIQGKPSSTPPANLPTVSPGGQRLVLPQSEKAHFGFVGNWGVVGLPPGLRSPEQNYEFWFRPHEELGFWWDRPHPGPFSWHLIEPQRGRYNFSKTDVYVAAAQERSIQVLATIWPFVDWDQEYWKSQPDWRPSRGFERELPISRYKPHDVQAYRQFVKALVERYDGDGQDDMPGLLYPIKYWEAANEPETASWGDLNFFSGNANDYLELLRGTYEAIKEADPEAMVLHGGAALPGEFWDKLFALGSGYFDLGNIHSINGPEDLHTDAYSASLEKYGRDFWLTEVQISSGEFRMPSITEEAQAELIVKGYVTAFGNGALKAFYTVYQADSQMPPDFKGAALIDSNSQKKPAYLAFQTLTEKLDYFTEVAKLAVGRYRFTVNGKPVYLLWGEGTLPQEIAGAVRVTDLSGQESIQQSFEVRLGGSPIFVEIIK